MLFTLYKIIGSFVVPPGILVLLLFIASLLAFKRPRKVFLGCLLLLIALSFYLLSTPITSRIALGRLENMVAPSLPADKAAIVVLGGGQRRTSDPDKAEVSPHTLMRLFGGIELAVKFNWPILLCGGSYSQEVPEAMTMAKKVKELFPDLLIYEESQSRTTWENIKNASSILRSLELKHAVLVTHGYHMPRAHLIAKGLAPEINWHPFPVGKMADNAPLSLIDFLPGASSLHINSLALKEHVGIIAYRIKLFIER